MKYGRAITGTVLVFALAAIPGFAEAGQRQRGGSDRRGNGSAEQSPRENAERGGQRAAPRSRTEGRQNDVQRQGPPPRQYDNNARQSQRPQYQSPRQSQAPRQSDRRDYAVPRSYGRPSYSYGGGYGGYGRSISPRIIRPRIVTVVPYRPYVYRPRFGINAFYGAGGSYPYGYTPRGYYDPLPGRIYGGLRITGASPDAQVFADGYYVGIVDDFDGIFQHVNLEAGPHHIEIEEPGYEAAGFDVVVQPGRTTTFRADAY
ncbi:MAG: hypothetical protein ABI818_05625 [Acidobacteriota bacterium]